MTGIILGNTGSGNTTYAFSLKEKERGVIFLIDYWNKTLFLKYKTSEDGVSWFLEPINRSGTKIPSFVFQLYAVQTPIILDLGFAKKKRRAVFYAFAKAHNIPIHLHFLDIPLEIRKQCVAKRNLEKGVTFQFEVSETDIEFMETWFEPPTPKELKHADIITT